MSEDKLPQEPTAQATPPVSSGLSATDVRPATRIDTTTPETDLSAPSGSPAVISATDQESLSDLSTPTTEVTEAAKAEKDNNKKHFNLKKLFKRKDSDGNDENNPIALLSAGLVVIILVLLAGIWVYKHQSHSASSGSKLNSQAKNITDQDVKIDKLNIDTSDLKLKVRDGVQTLVVNGDVAIQQQLRFTAGDYTANFATSNIFSGNQQYLLPNASGTLCLDSNNCGFLTSAQLQTSDTGLLAQLQALSESFKTQLQTTAADLALTPGEGIGLVDGILTNFGVRSVNEQVGKLLLQGVTGQTLVTTTGTTITIGTAQDISTTGTPTFGGLNLTDTASGFKITLKAGALTDNRTVTFGDEAGVVCTTAASAACLSAYTAPAGTYVNLQVGTPGTAQTGNLNISGTGIFGTGLAVGTTLNVNTQQVGTWVTSANALTATKISQSSVVANGYVYAIGGDTTGTVTYAKLNGDGSTSAWAATTTLPAARYNHASVVSNGYVYVIGGGTTGSSSSAVSTVYYAKLNSDGTLGAWNLTTSLPAVRNAPKSVAVNGYVYLAGGSNGTSAVTTVYYAKLNSNGTLGAWNTTSSLASNNYRGAMVVAGGYAYLTGGFTGTVAYNSVYYSKLNSDGTLGAWTATTTMPTTLNLHTSVVTNGYLYVIGGSDNTTSQTAIYYAKLNGDGTVGAWSTAANSLPATRTSASSVVANGYVYEVGGADASSTAQTTVFYSRIGGVVSIGGSLDLVGPEGGNIADGGDQSLGSTGGSITAGNGKFVGTLEVQGAATFSQSLTVNNNFNVSNILTADTTNGGSISLLGNNSGEIGPWQSTTAFPTTFSGATAVTANGYIYVMGLGNTTVYYGKVNSNNTVGAWNTTTSLPASRGGAASFVNNGYVYLLGGFDGSGTRVSNVYMARINSDGTLGAWAGTNPLPGLRSAVGAFVSNGYAYAVGGFDGTSPVNTSYYARIATDGTLGTWNTTTVMSSAAQLGKVIVAGGHAYTMTNSTTLYNAILNADGTIASWSTSTMPTGTGESTIALANGYLYVIGGFSGSSSVYYAKLNSSGNPGTWTQSALQLLLIPHTIPRPPP
jgi:N-acetylneuraminic acid mutarotase